MKFSITYDEIHDLVLEKSGKDVRVSYVSDDVFNVSMTLMVNLPLVGKKSKRFSFDLKYIGFADNILMLQLSDGTANALLSTALKLLKYREDIVSINDGNVICVNLDGIEKVSTALSKIEVNGISFEKESVRVDFSLR
ncbi:MAG: hypothetical protein ACI3ZL_05865 [Candidatus Cryptobacteroides sp.]